MEICLGHAAVRPGRINALQLDGPCHHHETSLQRHTTPLTSGVFFSTPEV
jgi:hypothetical protein